MAVRDPLHSSTQRPVLRNESAAAVLEAAYGGSKTKTATSSIAASRCPESPDWKLIAMRLAASLIYE